VYDFKDEGVGGLEIEVKESDARWIDGLATSATTSEPLKLRVTTGKVIRYLSLSIQGIA
jgi:hypothetical protein